MILRTSDAREQRIALVADGDGGFLRRRDDALRALDVDVRIWTMPVEIEGAIPFEQDRVHASYDGAAAQTFWRQLVQADRVFNIFRARFLGKVSPVHFFWGSFDLAVTRFSGRAAPPLKSNNTPNVAAWVMNEAYQPRVLERRLLARQWRLRPRGVLRLCVSGAGWVWRRRRSRPQGAAYNADVGQFLLDYDAVRTAASPDDALLDFMQSTYEAAANRGGWDRKALERQPK